MILHSELLDLRKTAPDDLDFVLAAEQDPLNRGFIGQWSREAHAAAIEDGDMLHLIIQSKPGKPAGYVILTGLQNPNLSVCILRIVIQEKARGYGKKTLALLTEWIFTHTPTHRLWLDVRDHNGRAQHVYKEAGFQPEGILRDCIKTGNTFESLMIMSILRHEYLAKLDQAPCDINSTGF